MRFQISKQGYTYPVAEPAEHHRVEARRLYSEGYRQVSRKYRHVQKFSAEGFREGESEELDVDTFEAFRETAKLYAAEDLLKRQGEQDQREQDKATARAFYAAKPCVKPTPEMIMSFADGMAFLRAKGV